MAKGKNMARVMLLTKEGKQKAFEADNSDVQINIKYIAIGDGAYTPNEDMTELQSEKMRVEILSKELNLEVYQTTLNVKFGVNSESFYIKEYGVFLDDGTLFAVFSEETPESPTFKNKDNILLMPIALNLLDSVNPDVINIIDNGADLKLTYTEEFAQIENRFSLLDTCCTEMKEIFIPNGALEVPTQNEVDTQWGAGVINSDEITEVVGTEPTQAESDQAYQDA